MALDVASKVKIPMRFFDVPLFLELGGRFAVVWAHGLTRLDELWRGCGATYSLQANTCSHEGQDQQPTERKPGQGRSGTHLQMRKLTLSESRNSLNTIVGAQARAAQVAAVRRR